MIELAYAETSAGPWLIFYGSADSQLDFAKLNRCFENLRDGANDIVLSQLPFIESVAPIHLVARCDSRGTGVTRVDPNSLAFGWCQSADEWNDDIGLLHGLRANGHQSLSRHPFDDATVIASLGEYARGWFSRDRH